MFYRQKKSNVVSAYNTQNTLYPMENYTSRLVFDNSIKFCIVEVHDLTYDISYNAKRNRSEFAILG